MERKTSIARAEVGAPQAQRVFHFINDGVTWAVLRFSVMEL